MKRVAAITILVLLFFTMSCAGKTDHTADGSSNISDSPVQSGERDDNQPRRSGSNQRSVQAGQEQSGQEQTEPEQTEPEQEGQTEQSPSSQPIGNEDISRLANAFAKPVRTANSLKRETDGHGLPVDLLNELKLAVFEGKSDDLLDQWNDESLQISIDSFVFRPKGGEELEYWEGELEQAIKGGGGTLSPYRLDLDKDGEAEIIVIERGSNQKYHVNHMYTLKQSGDAYELLSCEYLGYQRRSAVFTHQGAYYLAVNYDDSETKAANAVGLFSLEGGSPYRTFNENYMYIKKTHDSVGSHVLYQDENALIAEGVQAYVDEIKADLLYADSRGLTFCGNEEKVEYLPYDEKDNSGQRISTLYEVDADNDGQTEYYFFRRLNPRGEDPGVEVIWYDFENHVEASPVLEAWTPDQYRLKQSWFKKIEGKMVMFSLYRKESGDTYLLDARILENGRPELLLDAMLWRVDDVQLSDNLSNGETNWLTINYSDPDREKAIPETIIEDMERYGAEVQGEFVPVDHEDEKVPNSLIAAMEDALFHRTLDEIDMGSSALEVDKNAYFETYLQGMEHADKEYFDRYVQHVYEYSLDGSRYFLEVADSGGSARFVDVSIYKEEEGSVVLTDTLMSLDLDAKVISYEGKLYFIEKSYNYYSKFVDTVYIYPLESDEFKSYVSIRLDPVRYEWKTYYQDQDSRYADQVSDYVAGIREELMGKSQIDDSIDVFIGDESRDVDNNRFLRLKSVGAYVPCYEIDFDNDGEMEYAAKHHWYPSNYTHMYLITNFYKFTDERLCEIGCGVDNDTGTLIQQWFHELDGKIFTFKLYLGTGYNYFLNVSLIEGTEVTQVQTYIIAPKSEFLVSSNEHERGMD